MTTGPATTLERHQVPLYLAALVVGAVVGLTMPGFAGRARAVRSVPLVRTGPASPPVSPGA